LGSSLGEDLDYLVTDPLPSDVSNRWCQILDRSESLRRNGEPQPRNQAYRPQHTQPVFGEAGIRITDGADYASRQVLLATDVVEHLFADWIIEHAVDGEVPSERVFAHVAETHVHWVPTIEINAI